MTDNIIIYSHGRWARRERLFQMNKVLGGTVFAGIYSLNWSEGFMTNIRILVIR